jgi:hypothetical protein
MPSNLAVADVSATGLLHVDDAARAITAAAREHDRHGLRTDVLRQRSKERIDRQREGVGFLVGQPEMLVANDHLLAGWHQIDVVRFDVHPVCRDHHGHVAAPCDELVHETAEVRREVLHDHERHARIGRQCREQLLQRLEPTR